MHVEIVEVKGSWLDAKTRALNTVGLEKAITEPDWAWKISHLQAEHSPIRELEFVIRFYDVPYFVHTHLVRHHVGTQWYISTSRTDRTNTTRRPNQEAPIDFTGVINASALINISRKRLCHAASTETIAVWKLVKQAIGKQYPEIAACMAPECIYRGFCPEWKTCGFSETALYNKGRIKYIGLRRHPYEQDKQPSN